jgi:hypothetical protein
MGFAVALGNPDGLNLVGVVRAAGLDLMRPACVSNERHLAAITRNETVKKCIAKGG